MMKRKEQLGFFQREDLRLFLGISLGIFLFILFFQPFQLDKFDFSDRLLFVAGIGAIGFVWMVLIRITFLWFIHKYGRDIKESVQLAFLESVIILVFTSVSIAFYLRYVGSVSLSFFIMFRVVLICLALPVIIRLFDVLKVLRQKSESLNKEKEIIQRQVEKYEEDYLNKAIEFISDSSDGNLNLLIADIAFIKSADNYVEIVYNEGDIYKNKLIRNTLKNIEQQMKPYSSFIRCHRICIVNTHYIEKLDRNFNNYWLTIKGYSERIPVSRQYLLKLRESI